MINACGNLLFQKPEYRTSWLQEVDKQLNLCAPGGLQAIEMVSEPLCSREGKSLMQIKNCWSVDNEMQLYLGTHGLQNSSNPVLVAFWWEKNVSALGTCLGLIALGRTCMTHDAAINEMFRHSWTQARSISGLLISYVSFIHRQALSSISRLPFHFLVTSS